MPKLTISEKREFKAVKARRRELGGPFKIVVPTLERAKAKRKIRDVIDDILFSIGRKK